MVLQVSDIDRLEIAKYKSDKKRQNEWVRKMREKDKLKKSIKNIRESALNILGSRNGH